MDTTPETNTEAPRLHGWVVAVNTGPGGVPRFSRPDGDWLTIEGFRTDTRAFEKHNKPHRAVSLLSMELLDEFQSEGFAVAPGVMAENVTTFGVELRAIPGGARIIFADGPELLVSEQRRPCYQLNPMGDGLEMAAKGRSGILCSVLKEGQVRPGMTFKVILPGPTTVAADA